MPDFWFPPDDPEPVTCVYAVRVPGAPSPVADVSRLEVHRNRDLSPAGRLYARELKRTGTHELELDLSRHAVEESPLAVQVTFQRGRQRHQPSPRFVAFADPAVGEVTPAAGIVRAPGQDEEPRRVEVGVSRWAAWVYDDPYPDGRFEVESEEAPLDPARFPQGRRPADVRWRLSADGGESWEDLEATGERIEVEVRREHEGRVLRVEGYLGDHPPGRATASLQVPELRITDGDDPERAPPEEIDHGAAIVARARVTPPLAGECTWSTPSQRLTLSPDGDRVTVEGTARTEEEETATLELSFRPEGSEEVWTVEHEVRVVRRVVEVSFQRSPGQGSGRGIGPLHYRLRTAEGEVLGEGTTADGLVEVRLRGEATFVDLLWDGEAVASYRVTQRDEELESVTELVGQQRRLRILGYHLGDAGVDGVHGPRTDRSVLELQADAGLDLDGVVGPDTESELTDRAGA